MSNNNIKSVRTLLIVMLILISVKVGISQPDCTISLDTPQPVCRGTYFELSVFEQPEFTFNWEMKDGNTWVSVGDESVLGISIEDSTVFRVTVIDTVALDTCHSESPYFSVATHKKIDIEFHQLQLTCTNGDNQNGNSARLRATASGEFDPDEYHYFWNVLPKHINPDDSTMAVDLKGHQRYEITVRDNYGCPETAKVWTETFSNPEVEIFSDPDTAAYLQNPFVTYSFENLSIDSIPITNHFWWFQDSVANPDENTSDLLEPTYKYSKIGTWEVMLTVYNEQGCDTSFYSSIEIKPIKLYIPNVFTPGYGGSSNPNSVFTIAEDPVESSDLNKTLMDYYLSSRLVIFNRAGRTVFKMDNYDNSWDGDNLPDGVYYYILECHGKKSTDVFKGSVTIIRP